MIFTAPMWLRKLSLLLGAFGLMVIVGCGKSSQAEATALDTSGLVQSFQAADLDTRMSVVEVVELIKAKKYTEANARLAELQRVARTDGQRQALTNLLAAIRVAANPGK